jgi:hypothetical protein
MSTIDRRRAGTGDPYSADAVREAEFEANGWLLFAGLMILFTGFWNIFEGILVFFRSGFFSSNPVLFGLRTWAVIWIAFGVLEVAAAYGIMGGRSWARWFGVVIVGLSALAHMFAITAYPWWSLFILTIDLVILYGLLVHWGGARRTETT